MEEGEEEMEEDQGSGSGSNAGGGGLRKALIGGGIGALAAGALAGGAFMAKKKATEHLKRQNLQRFNTGKNGKQITVEDEDFDSLNENKM